MVMVAVLGMAAQIAAAGCTQADEEPLLCPSHLPAPRGIVIEHNALERWRETAPPVSCRGFRLTVKQVDRFLRRARETDAGSMHHTLPESPCNASGRVTFADGRRATWRIDQFANGWLTFRRGRSKILHCPDCSFAPFIL